MTVLQIARNASPLIYFYGYFLHDRPLEVYRLRKSTLMVLHHTRKLRHGGCGTKSLEKRVNDNRLIVLAFFYFMWACCI